MIDSMDDRMHGRMIKSMDLFDRTDGLIDRTDGSIDRMDDRTK